MSMIATKGAVFNRFNESFVKFGLKKRKEYAVLALLPYVILALWAIGFVGIVNLWWF